MPDRGGQLERFIYAGADVLSLEGSTLNRNAIRAGMRVRARGEKWTIGSGRSVTFWQDTWTRESPLRRLIQGSLSFWYTHLLVSNVLNADDSWNFDSLPMRIPEEIIDQIRSTPICWVADTEDSKIWNFSWTEKFSNRSACQLTCGRDPEYTGEDWSRIWRESNPYRGYNFFIWLCCHDKLPAAQTFYTGEDWRCNPSVRAVILSRKTWNIF